MSRITSREELWDAVNAALDARQDPLADAEVADWLGEHPADLEAVSRMDSNLRALANPRRRRAWPYLAMAAAAALAIVFWPRAPRISRSQVLAYRLSLTTETPTSRSSRTIENGVLVREEEQRIGESSGTLSFATLSTSTVTKGPR